MRNDTALGDELCHHAVFEHVERKGKYDFGGNATELLRLHVLYYSATLLNK